MKYQRTTYVSAEGSDIQVTNTEHFQGEEMPMDCKPSILTQHILLGAQNELKLWLEQQPIATTSLHVRDNIRAIANRWTENLSTPVLLLLAADDSALAENRGDWSAGEPAVEIIRGCLRADILYTLTTLMRKSSA